MLYPPRPNRPIAPAGIEDNDDAAPTPTIDVNRAKPPATTGKFTPGQLFLQMPKTCNVLKEHFEFSGSSSYSPLDPKIGPSSLNV